MKRFCNLVVMLCALVGGGLSVANAGIFDSAFTGKGQNTPLPVEQAFIFQPSVNSNGKILLHWSIPDGYYLYRDRVSIDTPEGVEVFERVNAETKTKDDPLFGSMEVYYHAADIQLQLVSSTPAVIDSGEVSVSFQGCWEGGICYPPVIQKLYVDGIPSKEGFLAARNVSKAEASATESQPSVSAVKAVDDTYTSEQDRFANTLVDKSLLLILGVFFLAGLALSLTPCVFPMIPIISSIIAGHGHRITTKKAFSLSLVYVLAVAVTYTIAGVIAGLFGANIQAALQNVWVISIFSGIFVLLALSMFGFFELQLPASLQSKLNGVSHKQQGGSYTGVAVMGFLSALIVGPCMAAPLAGALIYIGQSGDPVMGGLALFSMSIGMGIPLLLIGMSAGKLLPKAGGWMDAIKAGFGVLLLLMAIWMLDRVVSIEISMLLVAIVMVVSGIYLKALDNLAQGVSGWHKLWKGVGVLSLLYGGALLVGVMSGSKSFIYPLQGLSNNAQASLEQKLSFRVVTSLAELDTYVQQAKLAGMPVMLDFYADWCVSCVELDYVTFADSGVQRALSGFERIKVDVTANDSDAIALIKAYGVIGPPALIFYNKDGVLQPQLTIVGVMKPDEFLSHLSRL